MKEVVSWLNHFITLWDEMKKSSLKNEQGNSKENEGSKKLSMFWSSRDCMSVRKKPYTIDCLVCSGWHESTMCK